MLLEIARWLSEDIRTLAVFEYITTRAVFACGTALLIGLVAGPRVIRKLTEMKIGQAVRAYGPETHLIKTGTPTMGGVLILISIAIATLLWGDLSNLYVWILLIVTIGFGAIGWVDDYRKVVEKNSRGLPARWKYFWQSLLGFGVGIVLYVAHTQGADLPSFLQGYGTPSDNSLLLPFVKNYAVQLGVAYILMTYLVVVGSSNAVNLTDGLDGLAIMPTVLVAMGLGVFAFASGNAEIASYLHIPFIRGAGELTIFCAGIAGAGLGFLWFNTYPAQVFMGDVGALALGAALGLMAVIVRQEIVLVVMGGVFVAETVSVILQVGSFKLTGKRIFRMAPLHHHFELKGWPEPRVIVRFWIVSVVLVLLGLATLKMR